MMQIWSFFPTVISGSRKILSLLLEVDFIVKIPEGAGGMKFFGNKCRLRSRDKTAQVNKIFSSRDKHNPRSAFM